jgi:hypothetical protein
MNLPAGYQLDGAGAASPGGINLPRGYVLDPTGAPTTPNASTTALGAAGRGVVSTLPLGNQAYSAIAGIAQNEPYLQERKELEKETKSDIANNELARLAGQVAGFAAPALLTGGASAPASLGEAATQGAVMGAGFGAGNAIDTLAGGGSGTQAAGQLVLGAGLGAAGGAAGQKIGSALESSIPSIEDYAAKKSIQGVGLGSEELGNMTPEARIALGKSLIAKKIVGPGMSKQQMLDAANNELQNAGETIGAVGDKATELGLTTDTKPMLDALGEKYNAASQLANPDEVRNANFYKRGMADIIGMANRNGAERVAPDIVTEQPASFVTFGQLQQLKKSYGSSAFINGTVKNPAAADVYSQLSGAQKAIVSKAIDNPDLPTQLRDAMATYSQLHPVVDGLRDLVGREAAGNLPAGGFGMIGKLVGQIPGEDNPVINVLTSLGLLGAGHSMAALGASTATLQNANAMSSGAQSLANHIPSIASKLPMLGAQFGGTVAQNMGEEKTVPTSTTSPSPTEGRPDIETLLNHPALAKYKPGFVQNAARAKDPAEVQKANAVQDYKNSQTIPGYAADKDKAASEPVSDTNNMADGGIVPQRQGKPFNTSMTDKLQEFIRKQKERDDAQSR